MDKLKQLSKELRATKDASHTLVSRVRRTLPSGETIRDVLDWMTPFNVRFKTKVGHGTTLNLTFELPMTDVTDCNGSCYTMRIEQFYSEDYYDSDSGRVRYTTDYPYIPNTLWVDPIKMAPWYMGPWRTNGPRTWLDYDDPPVWDSYWGIEETDPSAGLITMGTYFSVPRYAYGDNKWSVKIMYLYKNPNCTDIPEVTYYNGIGRVALASNASEGNGKVMIMNTGDSPGAGYSAIPTIGPFSHVRYGNYNNGSGQNYWGLYTENALTNVTITAKGSSAGVTTSNPADRGDLTITIEEECQGNRRLLGYQTVALPVPDLSYWSTSITCSITTDINPNSTVYMTLFRDTVETPDQWGFRRHSTYLDGWPNNFYLRMDLNTHVQYAQARSKIVIPVAIQKSAQARARIV